ncbi:MAG: UDP-N-acetylmuramate--L-alanine ligase [Acidimicrobiia bacterium]|nr:UDP-N-acetylmuramate--L-alanine ligase [Acidimicrobiia bacterium]
MVDLADVLSIHLIGVGGAGMSAIAKVLAQSGKTVTGSDLRPGPALDALGDLGVVVWGGSRPDSVKEVDLVVASSAVPERDPEWQAAVEAGVTVWRRPQLLDAMTRQMPAIGATGTHGKTTSAGLLVAALQALGEDPSFIVGGRLSALGTNAHLGNRDLFVLEADEAFGTFQSLHLKALMVTNVEAEHLDHFGSVFALEDAFAEVVRAVDGPVVVNVDDPGGRRLADRTNAMRYGLADDAVWRASRITPVGIAATSFVFEGPTMPPLPVRVGLPGIHNAVNACGALALLSMLGYDLAGSAAGLADFAGIGRRFQNRGTVGGVTIVDDYAHHPTEVAATLQAARQGAWGSIWAVFQPHLYSRTARLHAEFGQALGAADHVVVLDVYGARELPQPGITGRLVADAARSRLGSDVAYIEHRADAAPYLADKVEAGDLILTMGAGDITLLADEVSPLLQQRFGSGR